MVIHRFVYVLVKQQCAIECVQTDPIPTAHDDIPSHVIDASTLGQLLAGQINPKNLGRIHLHRLDHWREAPSQSIADSSPKA